MSPTAITPTAGGSDPRGRAQVASVFVMMAAGITLCTISFFMPPAGDISPSAMSFMGEALIYAASVFGLAGYVDYRLKKGK